MALESEHAFRAFMETLWPEARAHGISRRTFDSALAEAHVDWRVLERANFQPEHEFSLGDYLDRLVSTARIEEGQRQLTAHAETFRALEAKYGVDRHIVAAIWGIESSYGRRPASMASFARSACWPGRVNAARPSANSS